MDLLPSCLLECIVDYAMGDWRDVRALCGTSRSLRAAARQVCTRTATRQTEAWKHMVHTTRRRIFDAMRNARHRFVQSQHQWSILLPLAAPPSTHPTLRARDLFRCMLGFAPKGDHPMQSLLTCPRRLALATQWMVWLSRAQALMHQLPFLALLRVELDMWTRIVHQLTSGLDVDAFAVHELHRTCVAEVLGLSAVHIVPLQQRECIQLTNTPGQAQPYRGTVAPTVRDVNILLLQRAPLLLRVGMQWQVRATGQYWAALFEPPHSAWTICAPAGVKRRRAASMDDVARAAQAQVPLRRRQRRM